LDVTQGHTIHDFFVFRAEKFEIIHDYFDKHTLRRHSATFIMPISSFEVLSDINKQNNTEDSGADVKMDMGLLRQRPQHLCTSKRLENLRHYMLF